MAKKNNEQKRQKKLAKQRQKAKRKAEQAAKKNRSRPYLPDDPQKCAKFVLDHQKLTTPNEIDDAVGSFCAGINPSFEPVFLAIEPEKWCRQSCCDLNVDKLAEEIGGRKLCGYKIWYHPPFYIEAERHAVHQSDDGTLRDPTFSADGENRILFVADVSERSEQLDQNVDKKRAAIDDRLKTMVRQLNDHERRATIKKMSPAQSWSSMITYEDWLAGERQQTLRVIKRDNAE